jgi:hypothetical protein
MRTADDERKENLRLHATELRKPSSGQLQEPVVTRPSTGSRDEESTPAGEQLSVAQGGALR